MRCVSCDFGKALLIAVVVAAALPLQVSAAEMASSLASAPAPEGLRVVWHEGSEDPAATLDRLERAGVRVEIAIPPHLFYVRASSRARSALPAGFVWNEAPAPSTTAV